MEVTMFNILKFYSQKSSYTFLGFYEDFARKLPDDIKTLCILQRNQIIHPVVFNKEDIRKDKNNFYGDMSKISVSRLRYEDDLFPTASSMLNELLRKDSNYSNSREARNKIHTTCRSQAILLASILKAKNIPTRVRSGFAKYIKNSDVAYDHWIAEYYNEVDKRWVLVDPDMCCDEVDFNIYDIPQEQFIFGAEAWVGLRSGKIKGQEL